MENIWAFYFLQNSNTKLRLNRNNVQCYCCWRRCCRRLLPTRPWTWTLLCACAAHIYNYFDFSWAQFVVTIFASILLLLVRLSRARSGNRISGTPNYRHTQSGSFRLICSCTHVIECGIVFALFIILLLSIVHYADVLYVIMYLTINSVSSNMQTNQQHHIPTISMVLRIGANRPVFVFLQLQFDQIWNCLVRFEIAGAMFVRRILNANTRLK